MIYVKELSDITQLDSCRLAWKSLLLQTRGASFFQSLDWLEAYWRHFGGDQRLRVLLVCAENRPVGILPLVVRTEPTRVGPVRILTYPLHDWGTFYGPIGPNPTATLLAGLRHIYQTPRNWDLVDLRWVDLDGTDRGRTPTAMEQVGLPSRQQAWQQAPVVELDDTWPAYWASRDARFRQNVERCSRRLDERGDVVLVRYRPDPEPGEEADPRWDLYDACEMLARRSWQGSSDDGTTLSHPSVRDFLRDAHAAAARCGSLDLNLLLLNGRPIAFAYNYQMDGRVYGLRKGFDPDFAAMSPGLVLQQRMLQDGFDRGDRHYDLGVGYHDAKRHWQTSTVTSYRFTHFPSIVSRVQLLRMNRWLRRRIYGESDIACAQGV